MNRTTVPSALAAALALASCSAPTPAAPPPVTTTVTAPPAAATSTAPATSTASLRGAIPVEPGSLLDQLDDLGRPVDLATFPAPSGYAWNDGEARWYCQAILSSAVLAGEDEAAREGRLKALLLARISEHPEESIEESGDALVAIAEDCTDFAVAVLA